MKRTPTTPTRHLSRHTSQIVAKEGLQVCAQSLDAFPEEDHHETHTDNTDTSSEPAHESNCSQGGATSLRAKLGCFSRVKRKMKHKKVESSSLSGLRIDHKIANDVVKKLDLSHVRELKAGSNPSLLMEKTHDIASSSTEDAPPQDPRTLRPGSKVTLADLFAQPSGSESDILALCERVGRKENWYLEPDSLCLEKEAFAAGCQAKVFRGKVQNLNICVKQVSKRSRHLASIAREVGMLRNIRHANIVAFIGTSTSEAGDLQLILEDMRGGDIVSLVQKKRLNKKRSVEIALSIARALAYLHGGDKPIIHRDLKPDNVLIDAIGEAKVADFGLARFKASKSSKTYNMTGMVGTLRYMAPEVIREEPYDEKVDVYALGLILYYMLTKRPPFKGFDWQRRTRHAKDREDFKVSRRLRMKPALKKFIESCTQDDARKRPSALEATEALKTLLISVNQKGW
eukprot:CAMPEP_0167793432 /NCGR_PEP_ID=MMETSP0111_2-20121227/13179_1 /TAXON_ID=91324 /ORGANISM="Lotharella globosa, Strain CCCM811" /LENGTH=456 /DNA_ID=CAMNT_0007686593 /DNA_START=33 /DNA_END=1401 /DNA_ORIENTATION=+